MATNTTYITLREEEKRELDQYIEQMWGENRITQGAAVAHLARKEVAVDE